MKFTAILAGSQNAAERRLIIMKKAALHNLGCKVNAYETAAMREMLEEAGYEIVPFQEGADLYIINTCTVTNIADRKSRQMLHRARKMNPDAVVAACGCYVQAQEDKGRPVDECVDIVIGNNRKKDLLQILEQYEIRKGKAREKEPLCRVSDISRPCGYEELHLTKPGEHTRAYIKVQDGCNQFCSYCIIPYARGRVRSRTPDSIIREVKALADNGYREVVLTGIHLSSYGVDFQRQAGREGAQNPCQDRGCTDLPGLIRAVHDVDGILRIRLGSLEPGAVTEEFAREAAGLPKLCPHFHLSLQSGCNATLKRMNRRYTTQEYYEKCMLLRKYFGNPALTTDVIVGFPGETEGEFQESMAFVDQVDFYETHIFKYSKREGTKAAAMDGQIPEDVKTARSRQMIELGRKKQAAYEKGFLGKEVEVLVEERILIDGKAYQAGHTKEYIKVALEGEENLQNCIRTIRIVNDSQIIH